MLRNFCTLFLWTLVLFSCGILYSFPWNNHYLTQQGFTILLEAANGQDLIERLESNSKLPDLCLLDIDMPFMDGYETARYLRLHYPSVKILAFTLFISETKKERILQAGADSVLPKESNPLEWKEALLNVYRNAR